MTTQPGPIGPRGEAGSTGATGAAGAEGATGAEGVAGIAGAARAAGMEGSTGAAGAAGSEGATGAAGSQVIVSDKRWIVGFFLLLVVILVFAYRTENQQRQIRLNADRLDSVTYELLVTNYERCLGGRATVERFNTLQSRLIALDENYPTDNPAGLALQAERIKIFRDSMIPLPDRGCGQPPTRTEGRAS